MMSRDEYVKKLKEQLDLWNTEAVKREAKTKAAQERMQEAFNQARSKFGK